MGENRRINAHVEFSSLLRSSNGVLHQYRSGRCDVRWQFGKHSKLGIVHHQPAGGGRTDVQSRSWNIYLGPGGNHRHNDGVFDDSLHNGWVNTHNRLGSLHEPNYSFGHRNSEGDCGGHRRLGQPSEFSGIHNHPGHG